MNSLLLLGFSIVFAATLLMFLIITKNAPYSLIVKMKILEFRLQKSENDDSQSPFFRKK